jgi:rod shape-determining protein MreC
MINRGTNDGLKKDMAVITSQGLVGNVVEAFSSSAKVELILDPRSAVGTIVQRPESRVAGIVQGNKDDKMMARMVNIPRDADVVEGDQIVTSGFGGVYPKGLAVGIVDRIDNDEGGLLKYAILKPAVDFQKLEEVAVIINSREALPAPLAPVVPEQAAIESDSAAGDTK